MASQNFKSAGVSVQEIDLTFSQTGIQPSGIPAGVIGTSTQGPAFVPLTVATSQDFFTKFGSSDGSMPAPIAASEWLRNASSLTFMRTLGIGDGTKKNSDGTVTSAGFVVGEKLPLGSAGTLSDNDKSSRGSSFQADGTNGNGRTYFLGCFMSASVGSDFFTDSGYEDTSEAQPVIRGTLMTARGVIPYLSCSFKASESSSSLGDIVLSRNNESKEEIVLILEGHVGSDQNPAVLTASFDVRSDNYISKVLNTDPAKIKEAGHVLYAAWDIHPAIAVVTSSGVTDDSTGGGVVGTPSTVYKELGAFLVRGNEDRNSATTTTPNFENFSTRFNHAKTPFVISQDFGGTKFDLFRLHLLHDGAGQAERLKFSIENIVLSTDPNSKYPTFDLLVRNYNDSDLNKNILEQFRNLSLDPLSDRYISKVVGDSNVFFDFDRSAQSQRLVFEGSFTNQSKHVRVEVSSQLENGEVPEEALPMGFRGIYHLATSGSAVLTTGSLGDSFEGSKLVATTNQDVLTILNKAVQPPLQMRKNLAVASGANQIVESSLYWGVQFEHAISLTDPNKGTLKNNSILGFMKYHPDFATEGSVAPWIGDNSGVADTVENGVLDADKFQNNLFSLENILVVTTSSDVADHRKWVNAVYSKNPVKTVANKRHVKPSDFTQSNREFLKFSFFAQGGFDGVNILDSEEAKISPAAVEQDMLDPSRGKSDGPNVVAFTKALAIMENTSEVDIQLLTLPGIRNSFVIDEAIQVVENRFDALLLLDPELLDDNGDKIIVDDGSKKISVENTLDNFRNRKLNTSFAASYFPDVNIIDPVLQRAVKVPATVPVLGAFSQNDRIGHPWFAPAGFTRGALSSTLETTLKLSKENIDLVYESDINPLIAYPGTSVIGLNPGGGVVVWGQKTLLQTASSLDRVNVRRLLIAIRRQVREISNSFIFEPNRAETLAKFSAAVVPVLDRIKTLGGLGNFRVTIDTTTTTQADIEANTIRGKVLVQPVKSIEFVSVDFVLANKI
jgi:phage tail sheath protein FI